MQDLSRKQRNLEIEKRVRARRTTSLGIIIGILVVLAGAAAYMVWSNINAAHLMVWNNTRIPTSDLRYVHVRDIGDQVSPESRAWAMESLQFSLAILDMARENGVALTAEEHADELAGAVNIRQSLADWGMSGWLRGIDNARMADLNSAMHSLLTPLANRLVPDYEPDEELFEIAFAQFYQQNWVSYSDMQVKFAVGAEHDDLAYAFLDWTVHNDFDRTVREHSTFYDEEVGVDVMELSWFLQLFGISGHDENFILTLQQGEISHIFPVFDDSWIMVYMYSREDADEWQMRWDFWLEQVEEGRMAALFDMVADRVEAADVELNERAWERFR
jgi:hypothetical protein